MNAQEIVQFHRNSSAKNVPPLSDDALTLGAAIEHLIWQATHPNAAEQQTGSSLLDTLHLTRWPATDARDIIEANFGVRIVPTRYDFGWLRNLESDLRARIALYGFTPTAAKALTGAVSEVINNVWQHAQATSPALLAYRLEPECVHIGVADVGIGVLNSLATNSRYASLRTSMAALKKAMAVGVSRYDDGGHGYPKSK